MIIENQPFEDLAPLTGYLYALQEVTERPSPDSIAAVEVADTLLTCRAVLYARYAGRGTGLQILGFDSLQVSESVIAHAELSLVDPDSSDYITTHQRLWTGEVYPNRATPERRQDRARAALMILGGRMAVSGAFTREQIEPAYNAIRETMHTIGQDDEKFTKFGLGGMSRELYTHYVSALRMRGRENAHLISNAQAIDNITAAWNVTGRPFGILTKLLGRIDS